MSGYGPCGDVVMTHWGSLPRFNADYYKRREREWRNLIHRTADSPLQKQILWVADEYARLAELAKAWEGLARRTGQRPAPTSVRAPHIPIRSAWIVNAV